MGKEDMGTRYVRDRKGREHSKGNSVLLNATFCNNTPVTIIEGYANYRRRGVIEGWDVSASDFVTYEKRFFDCVKEGLVKEYVTDEELREENERLKKQVAELQEKLMKVAALVSEL